MEHNIEEILVHKLESQMGEGSKYFQMDLYLKGTLTKGKHVEREEE